MYPENPEEGLFAKRGVAGLCVARPDGETHSARATGESVVAFKFGGTSLLGAERLLHAAELVRLAAQRAQVVVIVSAMKGVTDRLLNVAQAVVGRKHERARWEAEAILWMHLDVLSDLALDSNEQDRVAREINALGRD